MVLFLSSKVCMFSFVYQNYAVVLYSYSSNVSLSLTTALPQKALEKSVAGIYSGPQHCGAWACHSFSVGGPFCFLGGKWITAVFSEACPQGDHFFKVLYVSVCSKERFVCMNVKGNLVLKIFLPNIDQAWPFLAYDIRGDQAHSGWYGSLVLIFFLLN